MSAELSIIIKAIDQASGTISDVGREVSAMDAKAGRLGAVLKGLS